MRETKMRRRRTSPMHSNTTKPVRVVVLGKDGVGKSALTVRFLTRRFIGEYDQTLESTHRHILQIDNEDVSLDISDTAGECTGDKLRRWTRRGDLYLVLYSIVDRSSFDEARWIARYVKDHRNTDSMSMVIVATKKDLDHLRRVDIEEGLGFSNELDCTFYEVSISEGYNEVQELLHELLKRITRNRGEKGTEKKDSFKEKKDSFKEKKDSFKIIDKKDSLRVPVLNLKRSPSLERKKRTSSLDKYSDKTPQVDRKDLLSSHSFKAGTGTKKLDRNQEDVINNNVQHNGYKGLSSVDGAEESPAKPRSVNKSVNPAPRKKSPFGIEKTKGTSSVNELGVSVVTDSNKSAPFGLQKTKSPGSRQDQSGSMDNYDKPKGPFLLDRLKSPSTDKLRHAPSTERLAPTSSFGRFREGFGKTFGRKKAIYL